jgi:hypothetical protein
MYTATLQPLGINFICETGNSSCETHFQFVLTHISLVYLTIYIYIYIYINVFNFPVLLRQFVYLNRSL